MISVGQMTAIGPLLAGARASSVLSEAVLRDTLMRLAAQQSWPADQETLLETISDSLNAHGASKDASETGLKGFARQLLEEDADVRIDALVQIANKSEVLRILADASAVKDQWSKTEITAPRLDEESRAHLVAWAESLRSDEGKFASRLEPGFLAKLRYWGPELTMELGALWAGSMAAKEGPMVPLANFLQYALETYFDHSTRRDLFEILRQGGGSGEHIEAFFARKSDRSIRLDEIGPPAADMDSRILQSTRVASASPRRSRWALLRLVRDFLHLGGIVERDLRHGTDGRTASGLPYAAELQLVSLAALMRLNWQPFVLNGQRKAAVAALRAEGERILGVGTHGSYADILAFNALLGDMDLRYVAKDELKDVFVLGPLMARSNNIFVDRKAGAGKALKKLREDVAAVYALDPAPTVFIYAETERYRDPGPNTETNMAPFTIGAANVAQQEVIKGRKLTILPVASYGLRRLLPRESKPEDLAAIPWLDEAPEQIRDYVTKLRLAGRNAGEMHATVNQPVVFSFGEPIDVNAIPDITAKGKKGQAASQYLRRLMFRRVWTSGPDSAQLAGLQHFMNEEFPSIVGRKTS